MGRAVLLGGTGFTGGLAARALEDAGLPYLLTGRNPEKLRRRAEELGGPPTRPVDVTDPGDLRGVLSPGDVAVNCAGPFRELGEPVVRAAVREGAHYLDTTGEQRFMRRIEERWGGPAREAGVAVVNAMAFEYAPGDSASALALSRLSGRPVHLEVIYDWRGGAGGTSPGTRASILRVLGHRGWALRKGRWGLEPVARRHRRVRLPDGSEAHAVSFPAGEVVTAPRYSEVATVEAWVALGPATARAASLLSPVLPPLVRLLTPLLDPLVRSGRAGPDATQRREGRFSITARARDGSGAGRTVAVEGRDPYGVTAALLREGVRALLQRDAAGAAESGADPGKARPERSGVLAPSQLVEPEDLLSALSPFDVGWTVRSEV